VRYGVSADRAKGTYYCSPAHTKLIALRRKIRRQRDMITRKPPSTKVWRPGYPEIRTTSCQLFSPPSTLSIWPIASLWLRHSSSFSWPLRQVWPTVSLA